MNRSAQILILLLTLRALVYAADTSTGILIFKDPNTGYVDVPEIRSCTRQDAVDYVAVLADGEVRHFKATGVCAIISNPVLGETAFATKAKTTISELIPFTQMPREKINGTGTLAKMLKKWQDALAVSAAARPMTAAATPVGIDLDVKGSHYTSAVLTKVGEDFAIISHSNGASKIALANLLPDQIASLNEISAGAHISADWKTRHEAALAERAKNEPPRLVDSSRETDKPTAWADAQQEPVPTFDEYWGDKIIAPPEALLSSPSYQETIDMISTKLSWSNDTVLLGFGAKTRKFLIKVHNEFRDYVIGFVPPRLNPELKTATEEITQFGVSYECGLVTLESRGNKEIAIVTKNARDRVCSSEKHSTYTFKMADRSDADKVAKAFSHLAYMFGAKDDPF